MKTESFYLRARQVRFGEQLIHFLDGHGSYMGWITQTLHHIERIRFASFWRRVYNDHSSLRHADAAHLLEHGKRIGKVMEGEAARDDGKLTIGERQPGYIGLMPGYILQSTLDLQLAGFIKHGRSEIHSCCPLHGRSKAADESSRPACDIEHGVFRSWTRSREDALQHIFIAGGRALCKWNCLTRELVENEIAVFHKTRITRRYSRKP